MTTFRVDIIVCPYSSFAFICWWYAPPVHCCFPCLCECICLVYVYVCVCVCMCMSESMHMFLFNSVCDCTQASVSFPVPVKVYELYIHVNLNDTYRFLSTHSHLVPVNPFLRQPPNSTRPPLSPTRVRVQGAGPATEREKMKIQSPSK